MPLVRKFTDELIASLPRASGQVMYFEPQKWGGPSLCLRVGKMRYTWQIIVTAERKRLTLGHYPDMTIEEARRKVREVGLKFRSAPKLLQFEIFCDQRDQLLRQLARSGLSAVQTAKVMGLDLEPVVKEYLREHHRGRRGPRKRVLVPKGPR